MLYIMDKSSAFETEYEILTTHQIAKMLKKNLGTIQRWCRDGILPAARVEGQYLIRRADFDEWFASRRVVKTEKNKDDVTDRA